MPATSRRSGSAYARFPRYEQAININRSGLVHLANPGNPNLKPERQREYELGLDAGLFGDRVGLAFTYYDQYVKDLLLSRTFAPSTGYASVLDNVGELSNKGVELQLNTRNIDRPDFGWSTTDEMGAGSAAFPNFQSADRGDPLTAAQYLSEQPWIDAYRVVKLANDLLAAVPGANLQADTKSGLLAMARLFKAMAFGHLATLYESAPIDAGIDNPSPPFAPREEVLAEAITLLEAARAELAAELPDRDAVLDEILQQRRYELFLQGVRLDDLRRFDAPRKYDFVPWPQSECDQNGNAPC